MNKKEINQIVKPCVCRFFSTLVLVASPLSSCAPVASNVKDSGNSNAGILEGYALVFSLPQTNGQQATPASAAAPGSLNLASAPAVQNAAAPALKYCFEIPAGSTLNKELNTYNCRFFEYITGSDGLDKMKNRVWTPNPLDSNTHGIPAKCEFGQTNAPLTFDCNYKVSENGVEKYLPCSSYKDNLSINGKLANFVQITRPKDQLVVTPVSQSANSDAKSIVPTAINAAMVKGTCASSATAPFGFPEPAPNQLVDSTDNPNQTANPSGTGQTTNQSTNQSTPSGSKPVSFELNTASVKGKTALKTSSGQSNAAITGDSSSQCTISEIEAGTTIVTAILAAGLAAPTQEQNHYVVSALTSVKVNGQEVCPQFIKTTSAAKQKIFLFSEHWNLK